LGGLATGCASVAMAWTPSQRPSHRAAPPHRVPRNERARLQRPFENF